MKIFCLSDPHLGFSVNKPMDIYGPIWENHPEKIKKNWEAKVNEDDLVIVPGDISWASNAEQLKADMDFFAALPGSILFGKGNHENWWNSYKKASSLVPENSCLVDSAHPYKDGNLAIVGSRMWDNIELKFLPWIDLNNEGDESDIVPRDKKETEKIFNRELNRLDIALKELGDASIRVAALHYPPTTPNFEKTVVTEKLTAAGIQHCVFGHIHSMKEGTVFEGTLDGVSYHCCSCDYINFDPVLITEI